MKLMGSVQANGDAVVALRIRGPRGKVAMADVVADTGFNESLVLTEEVVRELDLEFRESTSCMLADGSTIIAPLFALDVEWLGDWVAIVAGCMDGGALMGMHLLSGCHLGVDVVPGGSVEIARIE